jgi:hypothetical protein
MTFNIRTLIGGVASLAALTLLGCGGGGGGGQAPDGSVAISGVAAKGPINGGDIKVYGVKDGHVDTSTVLGTGKTASDGSGSYSVTLTSAPTGPVVIEVSGGSYTDEASGAPNVALKTPMRAAVSSVANGAVIAVTPLTHLAFEQVEGIGALSPVEIDDANTQIGRFFKVDHIIQSLPFDSTRPAPAGASDDQKKYAAILGVISQLVNDRKLTQTLDDPLGTVLTELEGDLENDGGFSQSTVDTLNAAITRFGNSGKNSGGLIPAPLAFTGGVLQLSTLGALPANTVINGIDCTITLPAGVTVKADPKTGETLPGVVAPSSQAATNSFASGNYDATAGTLRILVVNVQPGFAIGEFAHVEFSGFPAGSATFGVKLNRIDGGSGTTSAPLTGITLRSTFAGL